MDWGVRVWDLRSPPAAAVAATLSPSSGCTALLYDECSLSLYAGCDDGALLIIDARSWRIRLRVPGVPMRPQSHPAGPPGAPPHAGGTPPPSPPRSSPPDAAACFAHAGPVTALAGHPSRRILLSGGQDGDVRAWSLPDLDHVVTVPGLHLPGGRPSAGAGGARQQQQQQAQAAEAPPRGGGGEPWWCSGGVASLAATEDLVISAGRDGACYALHQVW